MTGIKFGTSSYYHYKYSYRYVKINLLQCNKQKGLIFNFRIFKIYQLF